jgi:hypothetical protein
MELPAAARPNVTRSQFPDAIVVSACHLIAVAAVILVYSVLAPRLIAPFSKVFGDFDAELPAFTVMVINFSNWLKKYSLALVLLLVPDVFVFVKLSRLSPKWNWLAAAWAMSGLLAMIALLVVAVVAVGLPGAVLVTKLQ